MKIVGLRAIGLVVVGVCVVVLFSCSGAFMSGSDSGVSALRAPFDAARAEGVLKEVVGIGPRVSGTAGSESTRVIMRRVLAESGVAIREHRFQASTPLGIREMVNIVGVVEGDRPEVILLGCHYDTKYLPNTRFVGANDGGSTTAWMLEMARALGARREGYTLWLCFFDGEEAFVDWSDTDSLYGSREFVMDLRSRGELGRVKAMVNVDMIGDCDLGISEDPDAPAWLSAVIVKSAKSLDLDSYFGSFRFSMEDDHIPFRRAGIPSINLIDFRYGGGRYDHDRNWHTSRDRLDLVCSESLAVVGEVVGRAIVGIEAELDRRAAEGIDR